MPLTSSQKSVAAGIEVKVAGFTLAALGSRWDPSKHPRDSRGRFIETGGIARVGVGGLGKVVRAMAGGKVEVEMGDGRHEVVFHNQLTMVRRPDGSAPTSSVRKVVTEDKRRDVDPDRGDGKLDVDKGAQKGAGSGSLKDAAADALADGARPAHEHDADNPYDGDDDDPEIPDNVPDAYTPSRRTAKPNDLVVVTRRDKDGEPKHIIAKVDTVTDDGKPDLITLPNQAATKKKLTDLKHDDFTVVPFEDVDNPAALMADGRDDDGKLAVLDNETATDLVEGHSKQFRSPRGTQGTDRTQGSGRRTPITSESLILGKKPGTIEHDGRVVGRIEKGEDGKFRGTDQWGRPTRPATKWDTARDQLAKLLNAPPQAKDKPAAKNEPDTLPGAAPEAPAKPLADMTPAERETEMLRRIEAADNVTDLEQQSRVVSQVPASGLRDRLDAAVDKRRGDLDTPTAPPNQGITSPRDSKPARELPPAPQSPVKVEAATRKTAAGEPKATEVVHADGPAGPGTGGKFTRSKSGNLAAQSEGRTGYGVYRRTVVADGAEKPMGGVTIDGAFFRRVGETRNVGSFRDEWIGTERDVADQPKAPDAPTDQSVSQSSGMDVDRAFLMGWTAGAKGGDAAEASQQFAKRPTVRDSDNRDALVAAFRWAHAKRNDNEHPFKRGAALSVYKDMVERGETPSPRNMRPTDTPTVRDNDITTTNEGVPDEPVRRTSGEVLGDVPAQAGRADERPDSVLRQPGRPGAGTDRGGAADAADDPARGDSAADPVRAHGGPERSDRVGAAGPRVPAAGARDGEPATGGPDPVRVGRDVPDTSADRAADRVTPEAPKPAPAAASTKGGPSVAKNLAALRLLRDLDKDGRQATPAERRVLAGWAGWGALPKVFDDADSTYATERAELKDLLGDSGWRKARTNMLNAHYTDPKIVSAIWDGVKDLGFTGGDVLEPGSGSGNFIGAAPKGTHMTGVEVEPVTAGIAKQLYPDADIHLESFAKSPFRSDVFDAVVGNVPFGSFKLNDRKHNRAGHSIHNHFIVKSLDTLKPGGVMAVVTSSFTLDSQNDAARRDMYAHADLVGAVRLPENTHAATAGTSVVTDVLLFRKRKEGETPGDDFWLHASPAVTATGEPALGIGRKGEEPKQLSMSDYFTAHPADMLGEVRSGGYNGLKVVGPKDPAPALRVRLAAIAARAKADGHGYNPAPDTGDERRALRDTGSAREGRINFRGTVPNPKSKTKPSQVFERIEDGKKVPFEVPSTQADEFKSLLNLRDLYESLMEAEAQATEDDDDTMVAARAALASAYHQHVAKYGPVSRYDVNETTGLDGETKVLQKYPPVMGKFRQDDGAALVFGLESGFDPETQTAKESDVLTTRQLNVSRIAASATDDPGDAVALAAEHSDGLSYESLAKILQTTPTKAKAAVKGLVFTDPVTGDLVSRGDYESDNVRAKLAQAREAASNGADMADNIAALEAVLPADATLGDIPLQLGSSFVTPAVVTQFARSLMGRMNTVEVTHDENQWKVPTPKGYGRNNQLESSTWGTPDRSFYSLLESILKGQHRIIRVTRTNPDDGSKYVDRKASEEAQTKAQEIEAEFQDFVWAHPEIGDAIAAVYTEKHRSLVPRSYDGSPMRAYPGMTAHIQPRQHQNDGITRAINEPSVMFEHVVGAGKTYTLAGAAMELRRLGLARKPVLAVPGHTLGQWTSEFRELYPNAKILSVDSDTFKAKDGRKRFAARAANNDWDIVLMTHEAFEAIPVSRDWEETYLNKELDRYERQLRKAQGSGDKKREKAIQTQIEKLRAKIEKQLANRKDKDGVTFESLGFDYIMADEAHVYKNLNFQTGMQGINAPEGADRARDMHMKIERLRDVKKDDKSPRVVAFATGTPISNSLAEMYTMTRFMRPDLLEERGIDGFDAWAADFATVTAKVEQDTSANGWVERVRMRGFTDALGDALRIWRTFSDTKTAKDLNLPRPTLKGGKRQVTVVKPSDAQIQALASFKDRVETLPPGRAKEGDDTHVAIIGDGRRAAIDPRLMSARGLERSGIDPNDESIDSPKIDAAAANIYKIWAARKDDTFKVDHKSDVDAELAGALQMVMIDSDAPKKGGRRSSYQMLKDRLVAMGIPADQIRFVQEAAGSSEKKARLFDDARQGRVAVIMGSTAALGTGTNVQNRLYALHHIDGSWKPSDIEQREGRILRQGNQYPEVEVHAYVTEKTHDVKTWDMTSYKQLALDAIAGGSYDMRAVEFADDVDPLTDYDTITGLASGDPLVQDRRDLAPELKRLRNAERSHRRQIDRAKGVVQQADNRLSVLQRRAQALRDAIGIRQDITGDNFKVNIVGKGDYRGRNFTERPDAAAALGKLAQDEIDADWMPAGTTPQRIVGTIGGFDIRLSTVNEQGKEKQVLLELMTPGTSYYRDPLPTAGVFIGEHEAQKADGALTRLINKVTGLDNELGKINRDESRLNEERKAAEDATSRRFRFADDLADAERREILLDKLLTGTMAEGENKGDVKAEYEAVTERNKAASGRAKQERIDALAAQTAQATKPAAAEKAPAKPAPSPSASPAPAKPGADEPDTLDGGAPDTPEETFKITPAGERVPDEPADAPAGPDQANQVDAPEVPDATETTDDAPQAPEAADQDAPVAPEEPVAAPEEPDTAEVAPEATDTVTIAPADLPRVNGTAAPKPAPVDSNDDETTPDAAEAPEPSFAPAVEKSFVNYGTPTIHVTPYRTTDRDGNPVEVDGFHGDGTLDKYDYAEGYKIKKNGERHARHTDVSAPIPDSIKAELRRLRAGDTTSATPETSTGATSAAADTQAVPTAEDFDRNPDFGKRVGDIRWVAGPDGSGTIMEDLGGRKAGSPPVPRVVNRVEKRDGAWNVYGPFEQSVPQHSAATRAEALKWARDRANGIPDPAEAADEPDLQPETEDDDREAAKAAADSARATAREQGASKAEAEIEAQVAAADTATDDAYADAERVLPPAPPEQPKTPRQLPDEDYPLSEQQQPIADAVVADHKSVLVEAKAGAGKTSTLVAIAKRFADADPDTRIGYIAFNKSVQTEAEGRFPSNTEPRTGHSISFVWRGRKWTERKWKNPDALRNAADVAKHLGITEPAGSHSPADQAAAVSRAVNRYSNSADDDLSVKHFITADGTDLLSDYSPRDRVRMLGYAQKLWGDLQSIDGKVNVTNDHIRKMWALSKPDFSKPGSGLRKPVNVLFLDEAQDTPPVLAKVVEDQKMQKVIVGDSDQAIYGFTGAVDYLSNAKADEAHPLTKSYRFGPQVADWGNRFLQLLGSKQRVQGGGPESVIVPDMNNPDAILTRSNGGMFTEILREQEAGRTVGVPTGTKADLRNLIASARYLRDGGTPPKGGMHEDLARFRTWQEFQDAAEKGDDQKITSLDRLFNRFALPELYDIVEGLVEGGENGLDGVTTDADDNHLTLGGATFKLNAKIKEATGGGMSQAGFSWNSKAKVWQFTGDRDAQERALAKLKELAGGDARKPDVTVSTAHKSKGLEWGRVRIGDDFRGPEPKENGDGVNMPDPEELRLAYVAVTRAEKALDPGSLAWVLGYSDPNGEAPAAKEADVPQVPVSETDRATGAAREVIAEQTRRDEASVGYDDGDNPGEYAARDRANAAEANKPADDPAEPNDPAADQRDREDQDAQDRDAANTPAGAPGGGAPSGAPSPDAGDTGGPNDPNTPDAPSEAADDATNDGDLADAPGDSPETAARKRRKRDRRKRYDPNPGTPDNNAGGAGGPGGGPLGLVPPLGDLPLYGDADPAGSGSGGDTGGDLAAPAAPGLQSLNGLSMRLAANAIPAATLSDADLALAAERLPGAIRKAEADGLPQRLDGLRQRLGDVVAEIDSRRTTNPDQTPAETGPNGGRLVVAGDLRAGESVFMDGDLYDVESNNPTTGGRRRLTLAPSYGTGVPVLRLEVVGAARRFELEPDRADTPDASAKPSTPATELSDDGTTAGQGFPLPAGTAWNGGNPHRLPELGSVPVPAGLAGELRFFLENGESDGVDQGYTLSPNSKRMSVHRRDQAISALDALEDIHNNKASDGEPGSRQIAAAARARIAMIRGMPDQGALPAAAAEVPQQPTVTVTDLDRINVGDAIQGPLTTAGRSGELTVADAVRDPDGSLVVSGTDADGNPDTIRVRGDQLVDRVRTGDGATSLPITDQAPAAPATESALPADLGVGDVIEARVNGESGRWRIVRRLDNRNNLFDKFAVVPEGDTSEVTVNPDGSRAYAGEQVVNLGKKRPVGVVSRGEAIADPDDADLPPQSRADELMVDSLFNSDRTLTEAEANTAAAAEAADPTDDNADDRPEPLVNGVLANPQGMTAPADVTGTYSRPQLEYLADTGQSVLLRHNGRWEAGWIEKFNTPTNMVGHDHITWRPNTASSADNDNRDIPADEIEEIRGVTSLESLAEEVDPAALRPGTKVAFLRRGKMFTGVLEGVTPKGKGIVRTAEGKPEQAPGTVRPVLGGYRPGAEPTAPTFAPTAGVWSATDRGVAAAVPGEWVAGITPDGSDGFRWELNGFGDGFTNRSGAAPSTADAKGQIGDALWDEAAQGHGVTTLPGDNPDERDLNSDAMRADVGQVTDATKETTPPAAAVEDEPAAPDVNGATAAWVPTGELQPGDVARVDGDNGNGSATTHTGHVLGTPEPVQVHSPTGGRPDRGHRTTLSDDRDQGLGDRDTVLTPDGAVSPRVERPEEYGDSSDPRSAAESQVLSGHVGDTLPVDVTGVGVFPGSVVHRGNRSGVVNEVWDQEIAVRWADKDTDERLRPGLVTVDQQARPHGWTTAGQLVKAGQMVQVGSGVGKVESVSGDDVTVTTGDDTRTVSAGDLKVIGRVADDVPAAAGTAYDQPPSPEGLDVRPAEPVRPADLPAGVPTAVPNLRPEDRQVFNALGIDTDAVTPMDVQDAAARLRFGMPVTADQADVLAGWLDQLMGSDGVPAGRRRALKRLRNRVAAAGARAAQPTPAPESAAPQTVKASALTVGDYVAVPGANGELVDGTVRGLSWGQNGQIRNVSVEFPDGSMGSTPMLGDADVYLLPDVPDDTKPFPVVDLADSDQQFTEPQVINRAQESVGAVIDAAQGDDDPADLHTFRDDALEQLDGHGDARDQYNSSRRTQAGLERVGLDDDTAADAHDAAERAADETARQARDFIAATLGDARPLPGESDADAAGRVRDRLRDVADEINYDQAAADALGYTEDTPTVHEQAQARREVADALRADLFAMADELAAMGDVDNANTLSDVAARLAGRPDEALVQRAVAAASMGRGPSRVRSLTGRIRGMFTRSRTRFLDRVQAMRNTGAKANRSVKAAVAAARAEWRGDDAAVAALIRDAAHTTDLDVPDVATTEPTGFTDRVTYWRAALPEDPSLFGRTDTPRRGFRGLTLPGLRNGTPVAATDVTGSRLDRAADGGPGTTAVAHYDAVKGLGSAVDDEVAARVRAALPDLGDDPAGTVADARRYAEEVMSEERGDLSDGELAKLRVKARRDADDKAAAFNTVKAAATLDVLQRVRPMGSRGEARLHVQGRSEKAPEVKGLRWAEQYVPTDWLTSAGTVEAQAGRMGSYRDGTITVAPLTEGSVPGAGRYGASALHGLVHHLETTVPGLTEAGWMHHWARTSDGAPGARTRRGRKGLAWLRDMLPGAGFSDTDGTVRWAWDGMETDDGAHYEWLAAAFEDLFGDGTADDDLRKFMLGLLAWLAQNGRQ